MSISSCQCPLCQGAMQLFFTSSSRIQLYSVELFFHLQGRYSAVWSGRWTSLFHYILTEWSRERQVLGLTIPPNPHPELFLTRQKRRGQSQAGENLRLMTVPGRTETSVYRSKVVNLVFIAVGQGFLTTCVEKTVTRWGWGSSVLSLELTRRPGGALTHHGAQDSELQLPAGRLLHNQTSVEDATGACPKDAVS